MNEKSTELTAAPTANKAMAIYLAALGVAGVALIILTVAKKWGYYGYLGGGMLALAGFGGMVGVKKQGGFGIVACPQCGNQGQIQFTKVHRTLQCAGCNTWLHGAETMTVVPATHQGAAFEFWARVPTSPHLGDTCGACSAPATRRVTVQATSGAATAVVLGAGIVTTYKLEVPACSLHDEPVGLITDGESASKLAIGFNGLAAWQAFVERNAGASVPTAKTLPVKRAAA